MQITEEKPVFDNLADLMHVNYCDRIVVFFDLKNKLKIQQHPEDKKAIRVPFLAYIGGETKEELKAIASLYGLKYTLREGKRTQYPFELKLKLISFPKLKQIIYEFSEEP